VIDWKNQGILFWKTCRNPEEPHPRSRPFGPRLFPPPNFQTPCNI